MKDRKAIFITQTDKRAIYICISSILLFAFLIALMIAQSRILTTGHYFMVAVFSFFIVIGFINLIKFRQIIVTTDEVIIKFPFKFKTKHFDITDIKSIEERDYKIEPVVKSSRWTVHEGKMTTLQFKSINETLVFDSYETKHYPEFIKALRQTQKNKQWNSSDFIPYDISWDIVAWTFFIVVAVLLTSWTFEMYVG